MTIFSLIVLCVTEGEAWEEVDEIGEGGAVGEGRLRERDLLAFLEALPLKDMIARLLLFKRQVNFRTLADSVCSLYY